MQTGRGLITHPEMKSYHHLKMRVAAQLAILSACLFFGDNLSAKVSQATNMDTQKKKEATDSRGHVLMEEWASFASAQQKDRPALQEEILSDIKSKAIERRLSWDFWDASSQLVTVASSRNWKVRSEKEAELKKAVEEYDDPVVIFFYLKRSSDNKALKDHVLSHKAELLESSSPAFWKNTPEVTGPMSGRMTEYFGNDYEYAIWTLYMMNRTLTREQIMEYEAGKLIGPPSPGEQYYSYPLGAFFEFREADSMKSSDSRLQKERRDALEKVKAKYEGRAMAFYPRRSLLEIDFSSLGRLVGEKGQDMQNLEERFKELYSRCKQFEKERKGLSGKESALVSDCTVKGLISSMERESVRVAADGNEVKVILGNLYSAKVSVFPQGSFKKVFSAKVKTPGKKFYLTDTASVRLPALDDGVYEVYAESGKKKAQTSIRRYSLALAHRLDSEGRGLYAAASKTGKPVPSADIHLLKNGKEVALYRNFKFSDGFTHLPSEIASAIDGDSYYEIQCSFTDNEGVLRSTEPLSLHGRERIVSYNQGGDSYITNLYLDKGAYNPGEVVHFKGVLGKGDLVKEVSCVKEGQKVNASLYDSEGNLIETMTLQTNSFGSVAGEFTVPTGLRGGSFSVRIESENRWRASRPLRVDEFVLPSYYLEFDKVKELYLPGDEVKISGKISSYSGHNLSSAKVTYVLRSWNTVLGEGELETKDDGTFSLQVPTDYENGRQHITLAVKVVDDTGETQEFTKGVFVSGYLNLTLDFENAADAQMSLVGDDDPSVDRIGFRPMNNAGTMVIEGSEAKIRMTLRNDEYEPVPSSIPYVLKDEKGNVIKEGSAESGDLVSFDLSSIGPGLYHVEATSSIKSPHREEPYESNRSISFVYIPEDSKTIDAPVDYMFRSGNTSLENGENIKVQMASAAAPLWAVAELFGDGGTLLESRMVYLNGERGKEGSAEVLSFPYKSEYPDAVRVSIVFFRDGRYRSFQREYRRIRHNFDLPLSFSSFQDKAFPGREYTLSLKSVPDAEAVMTIYDKSVDRIASTWWDMVSMREFSVPYISFNAAAGTGIEDLTFSEDKYSRIDSDYVVGFSGAKLGSTRMMSKSSAVTMNAMVMEEAAVDMAAPMAVAQSAAAKEGITIMDDSVELDEEAGAGIPETVREDFATTLAFEPFIHTDSNGDAEVKFSTSDKLSTFIVKVYAHDRKLRNSIISKEMVVSIPVKVSVAEPSFLYTGDTYNLSVTLSSTVDSDVPGTLTLYQYDGSDHENSSPVASASRKVNVKAYGGVSESFPVKVPSKGDSERGLMVVFKADDGTFSDAVFVSIPVKDNLQTLTEAHSAVYLSGQDKDAIIRKLRSQFVNVSGYGATYDEISIIDMVKDAVPSKVEPSSSDVLSLSEAVYVRLLAEKLLEGSKKEELMSSYEMSTSRIMEKISACKNADGGFGWFEGMSSSPIVTAVVLERFSKLNHLVQVDPSFMKSLDSSVKFLDKNQFDSEWPIWCGGLSVNQYLLVRSYYASVPFEVSTHGLKSVFDKRMKDFKDYVKDYLVPSKERGLNGQILPKARRLLTITNLVENEGGIALAKAWGVNFGADSRLRSSLEEDVLSLVEYAIDHNGGGMYYPNAVMPFRGLLESEAYAHALICDLFTDYAVRGGQSSLATKKIADGIRIWLMLQKETQKWDEDPAFVDAIYSIMNGDDDIKATRIILMKQNYRKPFSSIKAAGNEMTIERRFYRMVPESAVDKDGKSITVMKEVEIAPGTVLTKGDRIKAVYKIWNKENRSFVLLKAPREATLRPVNQLSGMYGWGIRPMSFGEGYYFQPHGYRDVRSDRTEFYFDTYPEENTTISEEFYVMQTGVFHAPVVEIESLYAPHYRANASYGGNMTVK